eukprot:s588_g12.t2
MYSLCHSRLLQKSVEAKLKARRQLYHSQTIKINLPGKSRRREEKAEGGYAGGFGALAPPPPSAPSRRQEPAPAAAAALSPPAAAPVQAAPAAKAAADDFFGDFSDFQGGGGDPGVAAVSKGMEQLSFGGSAAAPAPAVVQASGPDPLGFPAADPFAGPVSAAPAQRPAAAVADPFGGVDHHNRPARPAGRAWHRRLSQDRLRRCQPRHLTPSEASGVSHLRRRRQQRRPRQPRPGQRRGAATPLTALTSSSDRLLSRFRGRRRSR